MNIQGILNNFYREYRREIIQRRQRIALQHKRLAGSNLDYQRSEWEVFQKKETAFLRFKKEGVAITDFVPLKQIGDGASGVVYLVEKKNTSNHYAMKVINKKLLKDLNYALFEKEILSQIISPWIVKLFYAFQDRENLYLAMEYLPGGDLMGYLIKKGSLPEETIVFYSAELVLAITELHQRGIIHRDIKPDNILFDWSGHIKLADFGLSTENGLLDFLGTKRGLSRREGRKELAYTKVGTPDYIAPEVLFGEQGYGKECDWWSLGVLIYEMFTGRPPFKTLTSSETYRRIKNWEKWLVIPPIIPKTAASLLHGLFQKAEKRLGRVSEKELQTHPFFAKIDWERLQAQTPPFVPHLTEATDTQHFDVQKDVRSSFFAAKDNEPDTQMALFGYNFKSFDSLDLEEAPTTENRF